MQKDNKDTIKPLLKWAGGKRWLLPILAEIWPELQQRPWVEPFVGGMALALGLRPKQAMLNDINTHLINFYRQVKKGFRSQMRFKNESDFYYEMRLQFNALIQSKRCNTARAASLFYYLIKTGFNGLCRFNRNGIFNVPFGQHQSITYRKDFRPYREIVANWVFSCGDFEALPLKGQEIIYADPPYDVEFTQYYSNPFVWSDQCRLARWLAAHEGPVIASNQATRRIIDLYKSLDFTILCLSAPRSVSCTGDRRPAIEILAFKGISIKHINRVKRYIASFHECVLP